MANITTTGASDYPTALDTRTTISDGSSGTEIVAAHPNGLGDAVIKVETELGINPSGSYADVVTRLNALDPRSGTIVQLTTSVVTGFTTTTIKIPVDNTPVQSTEGAGFGLSVNMKPTSTANQVYVRGDFSVSSSGNQGAERATVALFLASSSSAVAAWVTALPVTTNLVNLSFLWRATTVSTATTTYAVNIGPYSPITANTLTLNGENAAGLFGNTVTSILTVWEVQN